MPRKTKALRYVIQRHHWGPSEHFDVMLEVEGKSMLRTFQLPEAPAPERVLLGISCRETQPHRKEYLSYEGPVSHNRGAVEIWDSGHIRRMTELGSALSLELASAHGIKHLAWKLHFTGGSDWYLFAANDARGSSYESIG